MEAMVKLIRDDQNAARTFGKLIDDSGNVVCQTFELPWKDNQHNVSCIPAGTYPAFRFLSPHIGYELFQLANVPDRIGIDLHIGNSTKDTLGCILLGFQRGQLGGEDAILQSKLAFNAFMQHMAGIDRFDLTITDPPTE